MMDEGEIDSKSILVGRENVLLIPWEIAWSLEDRRCFGVHYCVLFSFVGWYGMVGMVWLGEGLD